MIYLKRVLLAFLNLLMIGCNKSSVSPFADLNGNVWGIDLSHHQGNINWNLLTKRKPHFIFLKATEGTTHIDPKYPEYKRYATQHSIKTGSYHFFNFFKDGRTQAHFFCQVANVQKGELPPVLDVEINPYQMPPREQVTSEIMDFINTMKSKTGVTPIIYCNRRFYNMFLKNQLSLDHPLWICDYRNKPDQNWVFWQKTDKHKIPGIKGHVDLNLFNGSKEDLEKWLIRE